MAGAKARVGWPDADLDLDGGTKRGKVTNGKGTGKKSGKGKKYPRDDDISTLPWGNWYPVLISSTCSAKWNRCKQLSLLYRSRLTN